MIVSEHDEPVTIDLAQQTWLDLKAPKEEYPIGSELTDLKCPKNMCKSQNTSS